MLLQNTILQQPSTSPIQSLFKSQKPKCNGYGCHRLPMLSVPVRVPECPDSLLYPSFSPQEYDCLKGALGLVTVNRTLDLEKAMKMLQWFKQSTCPCNQHAVRRGGQIWQLRPTTVVPTDVVLQLPAISTFNYCRKEKLSKKQNTVHLMILVP